MNSQTLQKANERVCVNRKSMVIQILVSIVVCGMFISESNSESLKWPDSSYSAASNGDSLGSLLNNFATNYDLIPVVSEKLYDRKVNLSIDSMAPSQFMKALNKHAPFVWYYDGAAIYFYDVSEMKNAVINLNSITPRTLKRKIRSMKIWDDRFHWKQSTGDGVVYISGPQRLIELVSQTASSLDVDRSVDDYGLKIFTLKYAKAADKTYTAGNSANVVYGVASTLRRLMGGSFMQNTEEVTTEPERKNEIKSLKGTGLSAELETTTSSTWIPTAGNMASIEADSRTNTVVVYDKKERLPMYDQLISLLDQPVEQVEIEVSIMNISTEKLRNIGLGWQFTGSDFEGGYNGVTSAIASSDQIAFQASGGLLGAASNVLLARIEALESTGDLQITSRPIVVTTNHLSALLDNSTTFYVRVAGEEEVDLYPVSIGAVLDVTPHIVRDESGTRIEMDINITDGQQNEDQVDGIPTVSSTNIVTQASVPQGESLLIGGYYYDSVIESESRVPYLHRIPLIGNLFKQRSTQTVSMSRMFLIRPRVLTLNNAEVEG